MPEANEVEVSTDELDSWFEEDTEEEEVLSAEDELDEEEEPSAPEPEDEPEPDEEVPQSDAQALDEGNSTNTADEEDPFAWVAELDDSFREKVERLVHSDQSNKGRVAALQRRLDTAAAEQEARERTQPKGAAQDAVPDGKLPEDMNDEELADFMKEFPSVASNVQKLIDQRVAQEREEILGQVRPIQQDAMQQRIQRDREALRREAENIFNTAETGIYLEDVLDSRAFKDWVSSQPPGYRHFAQTAETVEDASRVLSDFAMYTEATVGGQDAPTERAAGKTPDEKTLSADRAAARRAEARKAASPKSRSAEVSSSGNRSSYEAYFDEFVDSDPQYK